MPKILVATLYTWRTLANSSAKEIGDTRVANSSAKEIRDTRVANSSAKEIRDSARVANETLG